ncbi:hypothetical protein TGPRC2_211070 [Toxoplasma gondii TgCatPRC2]|uniref:Uncharacterized protein n=5 Tax=Toxoplasma gondii TaxID=5811 RepID=S7UKR0_TOXGG|nr:hypothetical protein TGME49_211070 [Toxoplasma gondii ME49]EPR58325.1 hypothetical protein TGGT1_211070 [Toxoplasma gondii GT1]KAF4645072.1 hypothetical protein TGRH88_008880 [Toxoplasma gondii]KYF39436.1 hypothetical protein TGARI_211070 [Toxoplasma gondii ARI]KYK63856.1 hypothetical protein TGPRC2_211070 [Toxoplasma gondii TgCatPRC2]EPT31380.1 hypothetical protein TGME49_211070 [Toxoplasma gondii ME49]|eukprot:XP_002371252.1 hypothetical protein TGME49_211070 [Toxoplasma gondii ME49]
MRGEKLTVGRSSASVVFAASAEREKVTAETTRDSRVRVARIFSRFACSEGIEERFPRPFREEARKGWTSFLAKSHCVSEKTRFSDSYFWRSPSPTRVQICRPASAVLSSIRGENSVSDSVVPVAFSIFRRSALFLRKKAGVRRTRRAPKECLLWRESAYLPSFLSTLGLSLRSSLVSSFPLSLLS